MQPREIKMTAKERRERAAKEAFELRTLEIMSKIGTFDNEMDKYNMENVPDYYNEKILNPSKILADGNAEFLKIFLLICHMKLQQEDFNVPDLPPLSVETVNEFNNLVLNFMKGVLPTPIQQLGESEAKIDYALLKVLNFEMLPLIAPESIKFFSDEETYKWYVKDYLLPLAKKQILEESIQSFIKNTSKLIKESLLKMKGGYRIVSAELLQNINDVIEMGLKDFFADNVNAFIDRKMQLKISSRLMTAISLDYSQNRNEFNPDLVKSIVKKVVFPQELADSKEIGFFNTKKAENFSSPSTIERRKSL